MKKKAIAVMLIISLVLTSGCGRLIKSFIKGGVDAVKEEAKAELSEAAEKESILDKIKEAYDEANDSDTSGGNAENTRGSLLGDSEEILYDKNLVPSVESYSVNEDFSNVYYNERFAYLFEDMGWGNYDPSLKDMLIKQDFAIEKSFYGEFFDVYEDNRYMQFPNFITVDSLMHTYHLYFAYLMKNTEKNYLATKLMQLSYYMMGASLTQYDELRGTEWESAALRNLEFFYTGALLQDESIAPPLKSADFDDTVLKELKKIKAAEGIETSLITGDYEDYSQYKVRGYYEGDETLENYFRAMMWYGRIPFKGESEEMTRSALLISLALKETSENEWESIYKITSFFAGASDDPGYYEYLPAIETAYGNIPEISKLPKDKNSFDRFMLLVAKMEPPKINSIPIDDVDENGEKISNVIPSFRFMGQRFTVDAAIFQKLIYQNVKENSDGERRMLPDTLDVAAALGSDTAYALLDKMGEFEYEGYSDNLDECMKLFDNTDPSVWNASLYSSWLNTLRPLFEEKGEGYPEYARQKEWNKKKLETFAGSYAELKHDTILYAKQTMAGMGGGDDETIDDRGYVDPEPVIYSRFAVLSKNTKEGLKSLDMLSDTDEENLDRLYEIAIRLLEISEKELKNETVSEEDFEFIRDYGGDLEHFWYEVNKDSTDDYLAYSYQAPCPVIADIATDPNGEVLEVGSGRADKIYVIVPVDGSLRVASGSVYSFYQFRQPISDRLTDSEWNEMLEPQFDPETYETIYDNIPNQPEWTQSYRVR